MTVYIKVTHTHAEDVVYIVHEPCNGKKSSLNSSSNQSCSAHALKATCLVLWFKLLLGLLLFMSEQYRLIAKIQARLHEYAVLPESLLLALVMLNEFRCHTHL